MNTIDRIKMVKCMEYIARHINHEGIFMSWLSLGVADQDIKFGDLDVDDSFLDCYIEDEEFSDLMNLFLKLMQLSYEDGGLQCDGICS